MMHQFNRENFQSNCDIITQKDPDLKQVIDMHGYPPMWSRENNFESLVHIILEQQVSLASALAALNKLRGKVGNITPQKILHLTDDELKQCYFSRQKASYVRVLAKEMTENHLNLSELDKLNDDMVRERLLQIKGIGHWTIDIYLIFILHRSNIFPSGDLAAMNALKRLKNLPKETTKEFILKITDSWYPHKSIATMILWHFYLSAPLKKKSSKK